MKRIIRAALMVSMMLLLSMPLSAKGWKDIMDKEVDVMLVRTEYKDASGSHTVYPGTSTGNAGEYIALHDTSRLYETPYLVHGSTDKGSFVYRVRVDGNTLWLTGYYPDMVLGYGEDWKPYDGWIKILSQSNDLIKTVDNKGIYRYFSIIPY